MFQRKFPFIKCNRTPVETQRVDLRVVCDTKGEAHLYTDVDEIGPFPFEEISIGRITISDNTCWNDLESMMIRVFKKYVNNTFAYCELGLKGDSIMFYQVQSEVYRRIKDRRNKPKARPISFFIDEYTNRIRIYLKGAAQSGAIDAMAFQVQLPKQSIIQHIERLETKGHIVLWGPKYVHSRIEMAFVARRLADYFLVRNGMKPNSHHVAMYNANDRQNYMMGLGLQGFVEDTRARCKRARLGRKEAESGDDAGVEVVPPPYVVVIENLHVVAPDVNIIVNGFSLFSQTTKEVPFVIGTFVKPLRARLMMDRYYGVD